MIDRWHNYSLLKRKKVRYTTFPEIRGRLYANNQGKIAIGEGVVFNCKTESNWAGLNKPCTISVGKFAELTIGDHCGFSGISLFCSQRIEIGSYVNCGANVAIWDTDFHPLDYKERRIHNIEKINTAPVAIGDDAFIGANSIILKGVTIGARSVIGAGSVVTKNIPADEIWAGNPARFIRRQ